MSKLRILGHAFGADIAVFEPDDGMPSPPAKLPVVGDEIEVWVPTEASPGKRSA